MKIVRFSMALAVAMLMGLAARSANAQARLFFDISGSSPTASVPGQVNPTLNLTEGDTATLYLWATNLSGPNQRFNGLSLDIVSSNPIVTATSYVWDNPYRSELEVDRWGATGVGAALPSTFLVDDANAVRLGGSSLGASAALGDDPFYDAATQSWRIAALTFTADAAGTTDLRFAVGNNLLGFQTGGPNIFFGWGDSAVSGTTGGAYSQLADATINVTAVPEPATVALMAMAGAGLLRFRRRRR